MRAIAFAVLAAALACIGLFGTTPAGAQVNIEGLAGHEHEEDVDNRPGTVDPTPAQESAARGLGSSVRWNDFGTPQSWTNPDGFLATGVQGAKAPDAAREFLAANAGVFGLDAGYINDEDRLRVESDVPMAGSNGHAVYFRQQFGGLTAIKDGSVTVGLTGEPGGPWKVAYISSSLTKDVGANLSEADATLTPGEAWVAAATKIGENFTAADVTVKSEGQPDDAGFTVLDVAGLPQEQRVRLTAIPVPGEGVVPAYETIFLHDEGGTAEAFTSFVRASDTAGVPSAGEVLVRINNVQQLMQAEEPAPPTIRQFNGAFDANSCSAPAQNGPYAVGAGVQSIDVAASADNPGNDIVLQLLFGSPQGDPVATADVFTSPESLRYAPDGGVPAGDYYVRVCNFEGSPVLQPNTYTGFFATNSADASASMPYPPKWKYFVANPPIGPGNDSYPTDPEAERIRQIACWKTLKYRDDPGENCDFDVANQASRAPWDTLPQASFNSTFTTTGNNAKSAESWFSPFTPGATQFQPTSQEREYVYEWTNDWYDSQCSQDEFQPGVGNDISAATAALFANHNRMHDWSYNLGFTEQAYNLQQENFGTTDPERENDPEIGDVQAGAVTGGAPSYLGRDNANQITFNDGIAPITNMYLWQPIAAAFYAPCVDGDYDMSVIAHEYGHAIQNRMVAGPDQGLSGLQARSMGESWSDLTAIEYLYEYGYEPGNGANRYAVGPYVTGNKQTGIRNYGMNKSPLNYSDIEYDPSGVTSPHADGEIWSATNYDIRQLLMNKVNARYPSKPGTALQRRCADGEKPVRTCPGNRRWVQIFHDAFLLLPSSISFLDARDAYLAADRMRYEGDGYNKELWLAFARRGMGEGATSAGTDDRDPKPSYASPRENNARATFRPVTASGQRINNFEVYVGEYEARAVPSATGGNATEQFAPGSYQFVVKAPGYGLRRFSQSFASGQTVTKKITMQSNWASLAKGAKPTLTSDGTSGEDGSSAQQLIDETEETNWRADGPVKDQQVTVDLAGGSHLVDRVNVSAFLRPADEGDKFGDTDTQSRFSALRGFEILTCSTSASNNCANPDQGFRKVAESEAAFAASVPRPLAPQLNFESFEVDDTRATHVQLRVISNQCTGTPGYHDPGDPTTTDQDSDPTNETDCRAGSSQDEIVRAAELEVFSR